MLINIGEIKDKLGVLTTISNNVSSILSKVNNLGSQKTYGFSGEEYSFSGSASKSFSGNGLLILIANPTSSSQVSVNNKYINTPSNTVIEIPCTSGATVNIEKANIFGIQAVWCPLS